MIVTGNAAPSVRTLARAAALGVAAFADGVRDRSGLHGVDRSVAGSPVELRPPSSPSRWQVSDAPWPMSRNARIARPDVGRYVDHARRSIAAIQCRYVPVVATSSAIHVAAVRNSQRTPDACRMRSASSPSRTATSALSGSRRGVSPVGSTSTSTAPAHGDWHALSVGASADSMRRSTRRSPRRSAAR